MAAAARPRGARAGRRRPQTWREVHGRSALTFETVQADPPHRLVTITEQGAVKHPIVRRLVIGHTRAIDGYLSALARSFEEAAEPEPAEPAARTPG